jgi:F0F1-type ATP synthase membrane subunit b/b'
MRRPNREISIFTLSALDVLAMSAGVFVLLLVMLMPYHRKVLDAHAAIDAVRIAEAETIAHAQTLEAQGTLHRAEAEAAEAEAAAVLEQAASLRQAAAERQLQARRSAALQEQEGDVTTPVVEAIDLIFVIDTTASMEPVLREVAHSLRGIVRILERLVPSVRIGIVAYRDRDTGLAPVTTLPPTPTDHRLAQIIGFVESLAASPVGSRTVEEDLYLGLTTAASLPLRPEAKQALIVVGDAAAHRHEQAQALFRAQTFVRGHANRRISTLFVTTPSSLLHGNDARSFFIALANAGGGDFNDHAGSMIEGVLLSVFVD